MAGSKGPHDNERGGVLVACCCYGPERRGREVRVRGGLGLRGKDGEGVRERGTGPNFAQSR